MVGLVDIIRIGSKLVFCDRIFVRVNMKLSHLQVFLYYIVSKCTCKRYTLIIIREKGVQAVVGSSCFHLS